MEILSLEPSCSMQTDGQADITKLIVASRNFFLKTGGSIRNMDSVCKLYN